MRSIAAALVATTFAFALSLSSPAYACFDGFSTTVGRVSFLLAMNADAIDRVALEKSVGVWARRIDAILPLGMKMVEVHGDIFLCPATATDCGSGERNGLWSNDDPASAFRAVAKLVHADEKSAARARAISTPVYAIQIFAGRSRKAADAVVSDAPFRDGQGTVWTRASGYIYVGGFPGTSPPIDVVQEADARGQQIFRVLIGAHLTWASAQTMLTEVRAAYPDAFIRAL